MSESKFKFTNSMGLDRILQMFALGGAETEGGIEGGSVIVQQTNEPAGALEGRGIILFKAEADGVAFNAGALTVLPSNCFELSGYSSGKKRMRVTYHSEPIVKPMMSFIMLTIAGDDIEAAAAFNIAAAITPEGTVYNTEKNIRMISAFEPKANWNLSGTDDDFSTVKVFGVGVALSDTANGAGLVSVVPEVW